MRWVREKPIRTGFHELQLHWIENLLVKPGVRPDGTNQNMFRQDFLNIFHYSNRDSGNQFEIHANNDQLTNSLLGNVKSRRSRRTIDESVRELVEQIAQSLIYHDRAYFYLHKNDEEFHIVPHSSECIFSLAGILVQYVPRRLEKHWDREDVLRERELRILDRRTTIHFSWPRAVYQKIQAQNKILAVIDKYDGSVALKFQSQVTHENPNPTNVFDFKKWEAKHDLALFRATRLTGWHARKHHHPRKSDFFDCIRRIRFRRMQLSLRDDLLNQLGRELTRVGREYWPSYRISISPSEILPRVAELDDLERRLIQEEASFTEVMNYCLEK